MNNWKQIYSAFHVAHLGTVSAAADALSLHRATIIRHIDALEEAVGQKLFQRHAKGYTVTELGQDLLRVAQSTEDQFDQFLGRAKGKQSALSGRLIITCIEALARHIMPAIAEFQHQNPDVSVRLIASDRLLHLEYGEAHIAIRAGARPKEPDNVVQEFMRSEIAIYASKGYIAQYGKPKNLQELQHHRIIGPQNSDSRAPFNTWIKSNIDPEKITFRSSSMRSGSEAVKHGIGIGFVETDQAIAHDLIEVFPPRIEWSSQTWLVTHMDLHRTEKVQAFLRILKEHV
jgi:DNA-binding transcriptional LysR family regulator